MLITLSGGPFDGQEVSVNLISAGDSEPPVLWIGGIFREISGWPCLIRRPSRYQLTDGQWKYQPKRVGIPCSNS
jgi:hypothetical protein